MTLLEAAWPAPVGSPNPRALNPGPIQGMPAIRLENNWPLKILANPQYRGPSSSSPEITARLPSLTEHHNGMDR